jgi:hypothetical protein
MTRPDYNALQPRRNAYNRKVDPYKLSGMELQGYMARLTRLSGTLKCNNQGPNQKHRVLCDPHVKTTNL